MVRSVISSALCIALSLIQMALCSGLLPHRKLLAFLKCVARVETDKLQMTVQFICHNPLRSDRAVLCDSQLVTCKLIPRFLSLSFLTLSLAPSLTLFHAVFFHRNSGGNISGLICSRKCVLMKCWPPSCSPPSPWSKNLQTRNMKQSFYLPLSKNRPTLLLAHCVLKHPFSM